MVGRPGDRWEREADRAADRIVKGQAVPAVSPVSAGALQRSAADEAVQAAVEDEAVQTAIDEEAVQAAVDEEAVQAAVDEEAVQAATEAEPVQAKSGGTGASGVHVPASGAGSPLPPRVRAPIESSLGADLKSVRVHDGAASRAAADQMGAKAFTQGSDIHVGAGHSANDLGLMAHESTHVVQQAGGSGMVQRQGHNTGGTNAASGGSGQTPTPPPAPAVPITEFRLPTGESIDTAASKRQLDVASVTLPGFKASFMPPTPYQFEYGRRRSALPVGQSDIWSERLQAEANAAANSFIQGHEDQGRTPYEGLWFFRHTENDNLDLIVTEDQLRILALRPIWAPDGSPAAMQVDHKVEFQLGGAHTLENFWLLEQQANASSGGRIDHSLSSAINRTLSAFRAASVSGVPESHFGMKRSTANNDEPNSWQVHIGAYNSGPVNGNPEWKWETSDIRSGEPLKKLRLMTAEEREAAGGSQDCLKLYFSLGGGRSVDYPWGAGPATRDVDDLWFYIGGRRPSARAGNMFIHRMTFRESEGGSLEAVVFDSHRFSRRFITIPLEAKPGLPWAGFMNPETAVQELRYVLDFPGMSPVRLDEIVLHEEKGVVARGRLLPTVPLIRDAAIDLVIDGDDVYLSKLFVGGDFSFPSPIEVGQASLELRLGTQGFEILGEVNFAVTNVGEGVVRGDAGVDSDGASFGVEGEFNFLSDLFEPARINVWYRDNEFGGRGELGIPEGQVNGLKSANIVAEWTAGVLTANGTFETDLPGVESGTMNFTYNEDGSYELGGTLQLGGDVPGIESGSVEASVSRDEAGEWSVIGEITAVPSIPGISSQISGRYENGIVTLQAEAQYRRGMADGSVTLGLTNQALDDTGAPSGEPTDQLRTFGGGQVTLTLAPWLQATAGIGLLPNGEIEVQGEIGLPAALEIFPERTLERNLFSVSLDIPIIGVAAAGQRIGIFATIGGGADLRAYFGPAQLRELRLGVTWNPDRPEETSVDGGAQLHLPAGAGIRLNVNAGIGAGIPLVSATLGLEIGGELGVEAAIEADFNMNWTPTTGLLLEAEASAHAEPVFRFDVTGFAEVELDLLLTTITLYEERWRLLAFEHGSGLRLGMTLPIRYQEGEPFEPSLDDVEFEVPDINPQELLSGLVSQIV